MVKDPRHINGNPGGKPGANVNVKSGNQVAEKIPPTHLDAIRRHVPFASRVALAKLRSKQTVVRRRQKVINKYIERGKIKERLGAKDLSRTLNNVFQGMINLVVIIGVIFLLVPALRNSAAGEFSNIASSISGSTSAPGGSDKASQNKPPSGNENTDTPPADQPPADSNSGAVEINPPSSEPAQPAEPTPAAPETSGTLADRVRAELLKKLGVSSFDDLKTDPNNLFGHIKTIADSAAGRATVRLDVAYNETSRAVIRQLASDVLAKVRDTVTDLETLYVTTNDNYYIEKAVRNN